MLITPLEILYFIILIVAVGFMFKDLVRRPRTELDTVYHTGFSWHDLKFAMLVAAPGIVLHELGHKFVALAFGLSAFFEIWPFGLGLGIILKLVNSPFILFAPGYVSISGVTTPLSSFLISFAGPLMNLLFFGIGWYLLEYGRLSRSQALFWYVTKQINLFLFIFNMLPIPPLDGFKVFASLFQILF
ncbi:MAG TPA: site-2 protease family protein [Candidatus Nanoarchaeia archaeon]|nr:site-2 protease family protein [Candidatus Nanoarchaeia archaeon]